MTGMAIPVTETLVIAALLASLAAVLWTGEHAIRSAVTLARRPRPGRSQRPRWLTAASSLIAGNPLLLVIAGIGFSLSFQTISGEAARLGLPGWHALYPIGIDVGILALVIEARRAIDDDRSDLVPRLGAWALSALTIVINAQGASTWGLARLLHIIMPSLWVLFLELTRWRKVRRARAAKRAERIPRVRWLLRPLRTFGMWRRMVEHGITSYPAAVAREAARLLAIDLARAVYGKDWKHDAPPLLVHQLHAGALPAAVSGVCAEAQPGVPVDVDDLVETWVVEARTRRVKAAARVTREERAIKAAEAPSGGIPEDVPGATAESPSRDTSDHASRGARTALQEVGRIAKREGARKVPRDLLLEAIREMYSGDTPPTAYRVEKELPVGEKTAKELLAEVTAKGADVIQMAAR